MFSIWVLRVMLLEKLESDIQLVISDVHENVKHDSRAKDQEVFCKLKRQFSLLYKIWSLDNKQEDVACDLLSKAKDGFWSFQTDYKRNGGRYPSLAIQERVAKNTLNSQMVGASRRAYLGILQLGSVGIVPNSAGKIFFGGCCGVS